jgi:drug/metabolite transporter (DMT)-like permease
MAYGVELALGAMICLGLADLVYKRGAAAGVPAHHFLMVQAWCFAPAVTLYGLATGTLELKAYLLWGMGAGLFVFVALYNFARSLATGSVSVIAPIFRLSFTVTTALAVLLLGEPLGAWKLAGLALALAAVWVLLGGDSGTGAEPRVGRSPIVQALIAMVAMGVANFLYKVGAASGGNPATFIAGQAAVFLPLATGYAWIIDRGVKAPSATAWTHAGSTAALFLLGLVLMFESLTRGQASVLVPITQMGFVVTAAIGVVFLREAFTLRKGAGLVFALAALAALALSG